VTPANILNTQNPALGLACVLRVATVSAITVARELLTLMEVF
jgi:hypothetical protein